MFCCCQNKKIHVINDVKEKENYFYLPLITKVVIVHFHQSMHETHPPFHPPSCLFYRYELQPFALFKKIQTEENGRTDKENIKYFVNDIKTVKMGYKCVNPV